MENDFIKSIKIGKITHCPEDTSKQNVIAHAGRDLQELLPCLAVEIPRGVYDKEGGSFTFKEGTKVITIFSTGKIGISRIEPTGELATVLENVRNLLNDVYRRKDSIDISVLEKRIKISVLDIYKLLPKKNCGKCGLATCMAFAAGIYQGEIGLEKCSLIFENEYLELRKKLEALLKSAGYL